jgi:hypothetical protein
VLAREMRSAVCGFGHPAHHCSGASFFAECMPALFFRKPLEWRRHSSESAPSPATPSSTSAVAWRLHNLGYFFPWRRPQRTHLFAPNELTQLDKINLPDAEMRDLMG